MGKYDDELRTFAAKNSPSSSPTGQQFKYDNDLKEFAKTGNTSPQPESLSDKTARGFSESFEQIPQLLYGVLAGAAAGAEHFGGEGGLASTVKKYALEEYTKREESMAAKSHVNDSATVAFSKAYDHGDYGALVDFLAHGVGYVAGQGLQAVVTAGVGSIVAKAAARKVAEKTVESMVAKETEKLSADAATAQFTKEALKQAAVKNVTQKIGRVGETAALAGQAFGMEGGEVFGDLVSQADKRGEKLTGEDLAKALGWSLGAGALELVGNKFGVDLVLGRKTASLAKEATGIGGRAARAVTQGTLGTAVEGGTEFAQTLMEEAGKKHDPLSRESIIQAIDAAALGALGGSVMGGVGGAMTAPVQPEAPPKPVTTKTTPTKITPEQSALMTDVQGRIERGEPVSNEEMVAVHKIAGTVDGGELVGAKPAKPDETTAPTAAAGQPSIMDQIGQEQNFQGTPDQIAAQEAKNAQPAVEEVATPVEARVQDVGTEDQQRSFDEQVQGDQVEAPPVQEEVPAEQRVEETPTPDQTGATIDVGTEDQQRNFDAEQQDVNAIPEQDPFESTPNVEEMSPGRAIMDKIADKTVVPPIEEQAVEQKPATIAERVAPITNIEDAKRAIEVVRDDQSAQREITKPQEPTSTQPTESTQVSEPLKDTSTPETIRQPDQVVLPKPTEAELPTPIVKDLEVSQQTKPEDVLKQRTLDGAIKAAGDAVDNHGVTPAEPVGAPTEPVVPGTTIDTPKPVKLGLFEQGLAGAKALGDIVTPEVKQQKLLSVKDYYDTILVPHMTRSIPEIFKGEIADGFAKLDQNGKLFIGNSQFKILDYEGIKNSKLGLDGFEASSFIASGFKKVPLVFDAKMGADGFFNRSKQNADYIFVSSNVSISPTAVVAHELFHAVPELRKAVYDVLRLPDMMKPGFMTVAKQRHDRTNSSGQTGYSLPKDRLEEEVGADLVGHAYQDVEKFWPKVFQHLNGEYGAPQAAEHVMSFMEKLRTYIVDIKSKFVKTTFLTYRGEEIAKSYVNNVEQFYDKLAPIVAKHYSKLPQQIANKGMRGVIEKQTGKAMAPTLRETTNRHFVPSETSSGKLFVAKRDLPVLIKNKEYPHSIIPRGALLSEKVMKAAGYNAPVIETAPEIGSDEEYAKYSDRVTKFATNPSLPEYARGAVLAHERVQRTNYKKDIHLSDAKWIRETVPVMSLRDANPDLIIPGRFKGTYRGSVTKGPIVLDHEGVVIDGNNRTLEAARSGKKTIEVYRPIRTKPVSSTTGNSNLSSQDDSATNPEKLVDISSSSDNALAPRESGVDPVVLITSNDTAGAQKRVNTLLAMVRRYPTTTGKGTNLQLLEQLHDTMVSNLSWLYQQVSPEMRERAKKWYDGAHRMTKDWSTMYGTTHEKASAVMAVMSPQMDWFSNVTIAERVLNIMKNRQHERVTPAMADWVRSYAALPIQELKREELLLDIKRLERTGIALGEMNNQDAARFVRVFDETYHDRAYRVVTPEGGYTDYARTAVESENDLFGSVVGDKLAKRWTSFTPIEKAIEMLRADAVTLAMVGKADKVRNFYKNIIEPHSTNHEVTIDTHAVAAAFVRALSGKSKEVSDAWSRAGMYEVYRRAYQDAAFEHKILPREMQSITWEAVRSLFPSTMKEELSGKVDEQWKLYRSGKQNLVTTREAIFAMAGGMKPFMWEKGGLGLFPSQGGVSFDSEIHENPDKRVGRTIQHKFPVSAQQEDETGNMFSPTIRLEHYSRVEGLTNIDPSKQGTGQAGAETIRQTNAEPGTYVQRSYYYRAGSKPEARFKGLYKYRVEIDPDTLFDLAGSEGDITSAEAYARDKGYEGAYNSEGVMPEAVMLFKAHNVLQSPTVEDIHALADQKGLAWDNNPAFMQMTKDVTGKTHLDRLNADQRQKFFDHLNGMPDNVQTEEQQLPQEMQDDLEAAGETTPTDNSFSPKQFVLTMKEKAANLKRFLKDSKVKHAVYHSTTAVFSQFKRMAEIGIHLGTAGQARSRFDVKMMMDPHGYELYADRTHATMKVHISLKNPLRMQDEGTWDARSMRDDLEKKFPKDAKTASWNSPAQIREFLQSKGYDGIVYKNTGESEGLKEYLIEKNEAYANWQELRTERFENRPDDDPTEAEYRAEQQYNDAYNEYEEYRKANAEDSYIVFDPTQIKSATGNNGNYDTTNRDISYAPSTPPAMPTNFPQPVNYDVGIPTKLDYYVRKLQDKNIDVSRMVEAIKQAGGEVPTEANPVLREEMYHKLVEQMDTDFEQDELKPMLELMRVNKVTMEHLNDYLQARHIVLDNLNAKLDAMNPGHPDAGRLAGKDDAWAQNILANTNLSTVLPIVRRVDAITKKTRQMMVGYGLESQKTINTWERTYQAYVPLRREGFEEEGYGTGTGRSVKGSSVTERMGSAKDVSHILANIAQARSSVIGRGEKMKPVKAMAALLMMHPNPDVGTLAKPAPVTVTNPITGLLETVPGDITLASGGVYKVPMIKTLGKDGIVRHMVDPKYKGRDNVVNFRIAGQDYSIVFNEENERAMEMSKAFKNLDAAKLNGVMAAVAPFTRYLASINTQYNPIFGIINFVRDVQFAMLALQSTPLAGAKAEVLKNTIGAMDGIYEDARAVRNGLHPTSTTAQMWERFQHVGGPTGYRDLFTNVNDRAAQLERILNPKGWSEIRTPSDFSHKMGNSAVFNWLSDYNTTMENAVRLGVFKAAVDRGISDIEAASLAKNITVNFNKKGQIGAQAGSVYAFFNANVQGSARIAETLFEPIKQGQPIQLSSVGKKIIAGGILVGVLQAFMLAIAGYDEDDVPEFVKQRTLVLPTPGTDKGYIQIPMPLGFNVLPNIGRLVAETVIGFMKSGNGKVIEHGYDLIGAILSSFIPVGGSPSIIQTVVPTVLDPIAGLESNMDWTGRPIYREDLDRRNPTPGHTRMRDSATVWAQAIARGINWATGGNEYRPGFLSPNPDAIDYTIAQVTGGVGRETSKMSQLIEGAIKGKAVPIYKVPVVGRFVGSASGPSATRDRYYETVKNINIEYNELKGRMKAGDNAQEFLADHPEARLHAMTTATENQIHKLQDRRRQLVDRSASREEVKLVEDQMTTMMKRVNEAYTTRTQRP